MTPRLSGRALPATAALYVGLVAAGVVANAVAGGPPDNTTPLYFATLPGSLLVTVFAVLPLATFLGAGDATDADPANPFGLLVPLAGGALVNVLLAWAILAVLRSAKPSRRASR
ncbi:hypothetical protein ACFV9D_10875 [Streptomyces sp. NPDC059875]|uniref:hypothetical protein n=1 Tax=unclassified Streptomyces TaxID=2593676 RepID=UPI00366571BB